jgi:hypothetical protein
MSLFADLMARHTTMPVAFEWILASKQRMFSFDIQEFVNPNGEFDLTCLLHSTML